MKKTIPLLVSQVPVIGAGVVWWNKMMEDPTFALIVLILYEILALAVVFIKKVLEHLEKEAVAGTAEWQRVGFLNFFSRFRRRYKQQVIYDHRVFNVRGLRTRGSYTLEVFAPIHRCRPILLPNPHSVPHSHVAAFH